MSKFKLETLNLQKNTNYKIYYTEKTKIYMEGFVLNVHRLHRFFVFSHHDSSLNYSAYTLQRSQWSFVIY